MKLNQMPKRYRPIESLPTSKWEAILFIPLTIIAIPIVAVIFLTVWINQRFVRRLAIAKKDVYVRE